MSTSTVKGQGHQGQKERIVYSHHHSSGSVQMERARCKQHHAPAEGTIPSLPSVISAACVRPMFGKPSLALVTFELNDRLSIY